MMRLAVLMCTWGIAPALLSTSFEDELITDGVAKLTEDQCEKWFNGMVPEVQSEDPKCNGKRLNAHQWVNYFTGVKKSRNYRPRVAGFGTTGYKATLEEKTLVEVVRPAWRTMMSDDIASLGSQTCNSVTQPEFVTWCLANYVEFVGDEQVIVEIIKIDVPDIVVATEIKDADDVVTSEITHYDPPEDVKFEDTTVVTEIKDADDVVTSEITHYDTPEDVKFEDTTVVTEETTEIQMHKPTCVVPTGILGYDFSSAGGTLTTHDVQLPGGGSINNFAPSGVSCASGYAGEVSYTVCSKPYYPTQEGNTQTAGATYSVSGCEPTCVMPTGTPGYNFSRAGGTLTTHNMHLPGGGEIGSFSPSGVSCANGYVGEVEYTICSGAGAPYSVSGCEAMPEPTPEKTMAPGDYCCEAMPDSDYGRAQGLSGVCPGKRGGGSGLSYYGGSLANMKQKCFDMDVEAKKASGNKIGCDFQKFVGSWMCLATGR